MAQPEDNQVAIETDERDRLNADLRREHDLYLRLLADFENFRRRVERDQGKTAAGGKREVIRSLLEAIDGFDRALPCLAEAPPAVAEGIRAIHGRLLYLLEAHEVTAVQSVGEPFDPAVHEAIGTVESGEYPPGTVAEETQRGYRLAGDLLRPARVRVAR
jgi:molecular chaperone GrpE